MAAEDVTIIIEVESKGAQKELAKINVSLKKTAQQADKAGKEIESAFKVSNTVIATAAAAVAALGAGLRFAINEAIKIEDLQTQFIAFTGSAESAADQIDRLADFAASTPFQLEQLARANRTLLAFGSGTEESVKQLKQLGEAAAATGTDITELATIFGQIQAETKLSSERFNQLVERGINIGPTLAKNLKVAESSLKDLRAAGKITADDVAKAFEDLASNEFAGSLERQSKTLSGAVSTLDDNVSALAASIGKILTPTLVEVTNEFTRIAKSVNAFIKNSKPERLRVLTSELNDLKDALKSAQEVETGGALGRLKNVFSTNIKSSQQLRQEIEALEDQIVNVSTGVQIGPQLPQTDDAKKSEEAVDKEALSNAQKLNDELLQLRNQRIANEETAAASENAALVEQLDIKRELILQKEAEKNIALLESQGLFEEAALSQAEENLRRIEESEKSSADRRKAAAAEARKEEFDAEKQASIAKAKFEEQTFRQRADTAKAGLDALANLRNSGNKEAFEVGKAAAIAQALIDTPLAAQKAFTSLAGIPLVGPALGAAAAAAAIAAGVGRVNQIRSQQFTAFQEGGVVPGTGNKDSVPALLTPGEVVVPERDFASLNLTSGDVERREISRKTDETNGLLREVVVLLGTQQSEGFLEEKFSSSTPGGIFYEPVDDGESERDKAEIAKIDAARFDGTPTTTSQDNRRRREQSKARTGTR